MKIRVGRTRVLASRNPNAVLFGVGLPGMTIPSEHRVYLYLGLWLVTVVRRP